MSANSDSTAQTVARRTARKPLAEKLAYVAAAIAVVDSLVTFVIYVLSGGTPNRLIGVLTLVLYLAGTSTFLLMTWSLGRGALSPIKFYRRYILFWFMVAGFVVNECAMLAIIVFAMVVPPPSFLPKSFISTLAGVAMGALIFTLFAFTALVARVAWVLRANLRRWLDADE
jgi:hypothetical protein